MAKSIYVDFAAATPLDERVLEVMWPYFSDQFYNPSSSYKAAKAVKEAVAAARASVAHWLGAKSAEVIFTAGATESINLAIHGVMQKHPQAKVLVSSIEHESVLAAARTYYHALIPVQKDGLINVTELKNLVDDQTVLLSIGYANNELGTIQSLNDIATAVREIRRLRQLKNNPLPLYIHTDASQAACYLDLHVSRLGVDLLTLNGGKMYGPKQTGVLFVKAGLELAPLVVGGGQEMGLRAGTENVAGIVGLAAALDIAQTERKEAIAKAAGLRDALQKMLLQKLPHTQVNGSLKKRLPNILHVSWPGIDGERLLMQLDERGIMASTGSACAANKGTASHVLQAVGLDSKAVQGSLRISLGRQTGLEDVEQVVQAIGTLVD